MLIVYSNIIIITQTFIQIMTKPRKLNNNDFYKPKNLDEAKDIHLHKTDKESLTTKKDFQFCSDIQKGAKLRVVEYCKTKPKSWRKVKMVY